MFFDAISRTVWPRALPTRTALSSRRFETAAGSSACSAAHLNYKHQPPPLFQKYDHPLRRADAAARLDPLEAAFKRQPQAGPPVRPLLMKGESESVKVRRARRPARSPSPQRRRRRNPPPPLPPSHFPPFFSLKGRVRQQNPRRPQLCAAANVLPPRP